MFSKQLQVHEVEYILDSYTWHSSKQFESTGDHDADLSPNVKNAACHVFPTNHL